MKTLLATLLLSLAASAQVSIVDNDGGTRKGRDVLVSASGEVTVLTDGAPFRMKMEEIAEITYENRQVERAGWEIQLNNRSARNRDLLSGKLADPVGADSIHLQDTDAGDIEFPINFAYSIRDAKAQFQLPENPPDNRPDQIFLRKNDRRDKDQGVVNRIGKDEVEIESDLFKEVRKYRLAEVEGVLFSPLSSASEPQGIQVTVLTRRGMRVTGTLVEMTDKACTVQTTHAVKGKPWVLNLHAGSVASIQVMNGNLVYLSDMKASLLDTWHEAIAPTDAPKWSDPWFFLDRQVGSNAPIQVRGKRFRKGIATRKHVELEFDLGGQYSKFLTQVGIGDEAQPTSTCAPAMVFSVLADGKEVWKSKAHGPDTAADVVTLSVKGVQKLVLVSDVVDLNDSLAFGAWGDARVVK